MLLMSTLVRLDVACCQVPPTPNLHAESSRDQITPTKILRREHPEHSQPFGHPSQSPPNAPPAPIHSLQHVSQHVGAPPAHAAQHAQHATHAEQNSQDPIAPTGPGPVKFGQISPSSIRQQASQVLFSGMPAQMSEQSVSHSGQPGPIQQRVNYPAAYQQQLSQHEMSRHVPGQHGMAHHEPRQHGMAQHGVSQQNLTQPSVSHDRAVRPHILHRPAELQHAQQHGPSQAQQLHHGQQVHPLMMAIDCLEEAASFTPAGSAHILWHVSMYHLLSTCYMMATAAHPLPALRASQLSQSCFALAEDCLRLQASSVRTCHYNEHTPMCCLCALQVLAQEADRQQQAADITTAEQQRAFMNQRVQQRKAQAQQKVVLMHVSITACYASFSAMTTKHARQSRQKGATHAVWGILVCLHMTCTQLHAAKTSICVPYGTLHASTVHPTETFIVEDVKRIA